MLWLGDMSDCNQSVDAVDLFVQKFCSALTWLKTFYTNVRKESDTPVFLNTRVLHAGMEKWEFTLLVWVWPISSEPLVDDTLLSLAKL